MHNPYIVQFLPSSRIILFDKLVVCNNIQSVLYYLSLGACKNCMSKKTCFQRSHRPQIQTNKPQENGDQRGKGGAKR